ncbi:Na+-driven multidrug efflux pump [Psychrobacter luti]|uniref:Na+-driven multidrug efflux pump n=2 Tax=Psychrobacter luti TaxID=198481 RepID=A0A839TBQ9_9GAMM|nr:MATE family Na+-driven efflux transporter [Psychrobacter luti]MBB3106912.1 Na+-driven multidrug efflux pump [Psychrobacter luti]
MMVLPSFYQTIRVNFLGDLPSDSGINIASQILWLSLIYEIAQEALILPLFYLFGKSLSNTEEFENKIQTGFIVIFGIMAFLSAILFIYSQNIVIFMEQSKQIIGQTTQYIRLETIAIMFATLVKYMMVVIISLNKDKYIYGLLAVQMTLSILLDSVFFGPFEFSLDMGVIGIAWTNIIVNIAILLATYIPIRQHGLKLLSINQMSFTWMKEWWTTGVFSGLESLVRNIAFIVMIIKMINMVEEQGNYWVANSFIWGWLLLPALALSELVKRDVGEDVKNIAKNTKGYFSLGLIFVAIWCITIPFWHSFFANVMNVQDIKTVMYIVGVQTVFYFVFIFNNSILDATLYGLGKTKYMFIQSLWVNVGYYGTMFILYKVSVFTPTLLNICFMFGFGILIDLIPTVILYKKALREQNIKVIW